MQKKPAKFQARNNIPGNLVHLAFDGLQFKNICDKSKVSVSHCMDASRADGTRA